LWPADQAGVIDQPFDDAGLIADLVQIAALLSRRSMLRCGMLPPALDKTSSTMRLCAALHPFVPAE